MQGLFTRTLGQWAQKAGDQLDALARVACQDLAEEVIDNTPIDKGFLVGNWQPSLNTVLNMSEAKAMGNGYVQSKLGLVVAEMEAGDTFYFTNNAAYARRIEFGFVGTDSLGRTYNQSGRHMVTIAIQRWPTIVAGAAAKLQLAA